jgi:hypothetical protein
MNEVLQAILASKKVTTDSGIERPLDYHIDSAEGEFVQSLIRKHRPRVILEVGCAYGISSLYIGEALREHGGTKHIIIDPGQHFPYGRGPNTGFEASASPISSEPDITIASSSMRKPLSSVSRSCLPGTRRSTLLSWTASTHSTMCLSIFSMSTRCCLWAASSSLTISNIPASGRSADTCSPICATSRPNRRWTPDCEAA